MENKENVQTFSKDAKAAKQQDKIHELKTAQINGERTMIEANKNAKYQIDKMSSGYVHILTVTKHLAASGKDFNKEIKIVKIHANEFDRRAKEGAFKTFDEVEVIHDPRDGSMDQSEYRKLMNPSLVNVAANEKESIGRAVADSSKRAAEVKAKEENLKQLAGELDDRAKELAVKNESIEARLAELQKMEEGIAAQKAELDAKEKSLNEVPKEEKKK